MSRMHERLSNPIHHRRHVRVICIGAGASGLLFAYKLQSSFENFSLTIYEKNQGLGGTWFENTYPGVACDYPAHNYTYTFEPNPEWPSVYVSGSHVRQYFERFAERHDLRQYCQVGHKVTHAEWVESGAFWRLQILNLVNGESTISECEILINAAGVLNQAKWPEIPGMDEFKGQLMHSAKWDDGVDLKGKRVGLIGNGASGQQILESIQPVVGHLISFIRQGSWTFGPFGPSSPRDYTPSEIDHFMNDQFTLTTLRKSNESRINSSFPVFLSTSAAQVDLRASLTAKMKAELGENPELERILIPRTGVGCRRPTPGLNYISAITAPNVSIAHGDIARITTNGVVSANTPDKIHDIDILICATGFDTSYAPRIPILNASGNNLQKEWSQSSGSSRFGKPAAYFAIAAPEYSNYLMFFGPGNPWASGSYLAMIEAQADYMMKLFDRFQSENWHSFAPKREAVEDLMKHSKMVLKDTVWADDCNSWYKMQQRRVGEPGAENRPGIDRGPSSKHRAAARLAAAEELTLWPGSGLHFIEALAELRMEDWEVKYEGNRFAWLGNGLSRTELDPESDKGWYIREKDEGAYMNRETRRKVKTARNATTKCGMSI